MVDVQEVHDDHLVRRRHARPVLAGAEGLGHGPERLGRTAEPGLLVGGEPVEAGRNVGEGALAVVAAAVAVGGVDGGVVDEGVGGVDGDGVDVRHDDVGAGGVGGVVEVEAVEGEGDGVVGVDGADVVVAETGGVQGVGVPVRFVGRVPEQEGGVGGQPADLVGDGGGVLVGAAHVVHDPEADLVAAGKEGVDVGVVEGRVWVAGDDVDHVIALVLEDVGLVDALLGEAAPADVEGVGEERGPGSIGGVLNHKTAVEAVQFYRAPGVCPSWEDVQLSVRSNALVAQRRRH